MIKRRQMQFCSGSLPHLRRLDGKLVAFKTTKMQLNNEDHLKWQKKEVQAYGGFDWLECCTRLRT